MNISHLEENINNECINIIGEQNDHVIYVIDNTAASSKSMRIVEGTSIIGELRIFIVKYDTVTVNPDIRKATL